MLAIFAALGLFGNSKNYTGTSVAISNSYVANRAVVFNCGVNIDTGTLKDLYKWLIALSVVMSPTGNGPNHNISLELEFYRDFTIPFEFDFGVSRENRNASALWLSAYTGNHIGNSLGYLNEVLQRIEIAREKEGTTTKLLVKWWRVAGTLGGLAGFQVVSGLVALLYCRGGFEVVDDVSTLSSMFADFSIGLEEEKRQEGAVHEGKFVRKGDKARWVLFTGGEKDIKVT